jgi:hypothetical protein
MLGTRWIIALWLPVAATACSKDVGERIIAAPAERTASSAADHRHILAAAFKKSGAWRRFRVKVESGRTIRLTTMAQPVTGCDVDDTACSTCPPDAASCGPIYTFGSVDSISAPAFGAESITVRTDSPADPSLPPFDAGQPYYIGDDSSALDGPGGFYCPAVVENAHFETRGHHFATHGYSYIVTSLPSRINIPKARYMLPMGPWLSDDKAARVWSGTVDGTCWVRNYNFMGFIIQGGWVAWYGFKGDYEQIGDGTHVAFTGGSGSSGGGTFPDAANALDWYFKTGQCTPGWIIVIDGVREC